jgi:hypothetical protein
MLLNEINEIRPRTDLYSFISYLYPANYRLVRLGSQHGLVLGCIGIQRKAFSYALKSPINSAQKELLGVRNNPNAIPERTPSVNHSLQDTLIGVHGGAFGGKVHISQFGDADAETAVGLRGGQEDE